MDVSPLLPLLDRVTSEQPGEPHPEARSIDTATDAWARETGLVPGDPDASPLGRARFGRLAARLFPAAQTARVELAGRWLTWLFAFDDSRDNGGLGASATTVDTLYGRLLTALRRERPDPEASALERTLVELWAETGPLTSAGWRQRLVAGMAEHRRACGEEAVRRRLGQAPRIAEYPALRRRSAGMWIFDLAEPVLDREAPELLRRSPGWHVLLETAADLVTWCNDLVSHTAELPHGALDNLRTVLAVHQGLDPAQAERAVLDRIAERAADLAATADRLAASCRSLGLPDADVEPFLTVVAGAPRAHLEWTQESGRYSTPDRHGPRRLLRLDGDDLPRQGRRRSGEGTDSLSPSGTGWSALD